MINLNEDEEINIIENKLKECEDDFYKLLKTVLVELKIIGNSIVEKPTFRIKSAKSIRDKIMDRDYINFDNFLISMKDLLGIRVICLNLSSLENIYIALHNSRNIHFFEDLERRYIETPAADGYRGIHLYFTVKNETLNNSDLKGEIQLRTIAQHYWATFSHPDVYKARPALSSSEEERIKNLSDDLYSIDKQLDGLRLDIKSDPYAINIKTLNSLFQQTGYRISSEDTQTFFNMISGTHKTANGILVRDIFGNNNTLSIYKALDSKKNEMEKDISKFKEWTNRLYNFAFQRDATDIELIFCHLYVYFKGFYWPKRRLFEYVLSLKNEQWVNLLGNKSPRNLVSLLEAAIYENIDRHSYYYSNFEDRENEPHFGKYTDSNLLSNRGIEVLSKNDLLTVKLDPKVRVYPDKKELIDSVQYEQILKINPDFFNFSYKKDTYHIKCTSKGKNVSLEIIRKLFGESFSLEPILNELELEDFPYPDFPYENPTSWGFPVYSASIYQYKREDIEKGLSFYKKDWWTGKQGYC